MGYAANMIKEEWLPIPHKPDYYASNMGRLKSFRRLAPRATARPRILKLTPDPAGYLRNGIGYAHRLVAAAWIGPCPEGKEVSHRNHVRDDNRAENLRYLTRQENLAERDMTKLYSKERCPCCGHRLRNRRSKAFHSADKLPYVGLTTERSSIWD